MSHLGLWHSLGGMAAQQHLLVQCHLFTLRLLLKVLSQVCGKKHSQLGYLLELARLEWDTIICKTWPGEVSKFSTLEMATHGLAEHVALQLAPKPHGDRWHQACCLLQAAWLVQRCLSAARGARHQAKAIALSLTPPLPPILLSPASDSLQLPSV